MAEETQVLVKFITKLPAHLKVPETPVAVPASLKRYGLSQIINHLLALDPPRPFDFLVDSELLRRSLEQHIMAHNLSAESTLEVEYVPAVVPPQQKSASPHDDWVSSVDASRCSPSPSPSGPTGVILSGSYDGLLRVWNGDLHCTSATPAHEGGVNCVRYLPPSQGNLLLTCGKDLTVKLWKLEDPPAAGPGPGSAPHPHPPRLLATYRAHSDAVEAVAVSPGGTRMASCGWDGRLMVWETGRPVADAADADAATGTGTEGSKKKRRTAAGKEANGAANGAANGGGASGGGGDVITVTEASAELTGHLHCVAAVSWPEEETLVSGGWDHSVRRWDVSTGAATAIYNGSKAVLCVATHGSSPHLVAFGCSDRALRLWDTRGPTRPGAASETLAVTTHGSHANWVTAVAWCPSSAYHLATASHDGSVKLWDVRTAVPLGALEGHGDKVLCVGWLGGGGLGNGAQPSGGLVSGGADCHLRLWHGV
uniref:Ribosome biogenesis protein WDR12 homolog n=1 Tax=Volvox ferrisii TaxID=1075618 RepID=A0A075M1B1_9CHLO|nr:WD40 protein [Volvox ferrisii]